jgi:hypothetical protein
MPEFNGEDAEGDGELGFAVPGEAVAHCSEWLR